MAKYQRKVYDKWYVYQIVNEMGEVEYVGKTATPKRRWSQHTAKERYSSGQGLFGNRTDVKFEIIKEFVNERTAELYEMQTKLELGLPVTECNIVGSKLMKVVQVKAICSKTGKELGVYSSIYKAAKELNVGFRSISSCIKGRVKVVDRKYIFQHLV
jgi:predicted GIY-YIG superfamily endonuclease